MNLFNKSFFLSLIIYAYLDKIKAADVSTSDHNFHWVFDELSYLQVTKTIKFDKYQECQSEHIIDFSNVTLFSRQRFVYFKGNFVVKKDLYQTLYVRLNTFEIF